MQPYKGVNTRHTCPQCERKRCFVRYIDVQGEITFPNYVGRCNREDNCGYHYTPKQYFQDHPDAVKEKIIFEKPIVVPPKATSFIDVAIVSKSLQKYDNNNLSLFLSRLFDAVTMQELMHTYKVGTAAFWNGATVFWQTDIDENTRTGKIMLYNPDTGKRVKEPHNHITWVHAILKYKNFNLKQCFFGEHLLRGETKPVAIVESEKTAMIASRYVPEYIWLATGGKGNCLTVNYQVLQGRKVVLFPDINAFEDWNTRASFLKFKGIQIEVSAYLEENATDEQRTSGYDIADFLIQSKPQETLLNAMIKKNPALKILIETLDLVEL